ncbi:hypothetical protein ACFL34_03340 [Candidatus Sumerlaeota bacterium]
MVNRSLILSLLFCCYVGALAVQAAGVPQEINWQGMVEVNGVPFSGTGDFKFRITDTTGTVTLWSNDGTTGTEPVSAVTLNVTKGLLSVRLGNTAHPNMTALSPSVFEKPATWLEFWFDDGTHGFQKLGPKQKLASVPYAMMAQTVPDNSINGWKLQRESVWPEHEGRSNTIVSYFAAYNGSSARIMVGTVPTSKTFVITDIILSSVQDTYNASVQVEYDKDSQTTVLFLGFKQAFWQASGGIMSEPMSMSLRAGLPVPGGAELYVKPAHTWPHAQYCTISGFEFEN